MNVDLPAGKYVVAVSGGVDSVVLLHVLTQAQRRTYPLLELVIAHYDHGIRTDSIEDRRLVQNMAKQYGLPFVYEEGRLGSGVSEAKAREARYRFLHAVQKAHGAEAIITAHHQDDLLETVVLNLLRGTGRRGLSSLKSTNSIRRPFLPVSKRQILEYARMHKLAWREDSTNSDETYMRNYVRRKLLNRFSETDRKQLLVLATQTKMLNAEIEKELEKYLDAQPTPVTLDRAQFIQLPHGVAREVMAAWLKKQTDVEVTKRLLERLVVAAKTAKTGNKLDIDVAHWLYVSDNSLALQLRQR